MVIQSTVEIQGIWRRKGKGSLVEEQRGGKKEEITEGKNERVKIFVLCEVKTIQFLEPGCWVLIPTWPFTCYGILDKFLNLAVPL